MNFLIVLKSLNLALLTFSQVEIETHRSFPNLSNNFPKQESSQGKESEKVIEYIEEAEEELKRRYKLDFFAIVFRENHTTLNQFLQLNNLFFSNNSNSTTSCREILPRSPPIS